MKKIVVLLLMFNLQGCFLRKKELNTNHRLAITQQVSHVKQDDLIIPIDLNQWSVPSSWKIFKQTSNQVDLSRSDIIDLKGGSSQFSIGVIPNSHERSLKNIFLLSQIINASMIYPWSDVDSSVEVRPSYIAHHITYSRGFGHVIQVMDLYYFQHQTYLIKYRTTYYSGGLVEIKDLVRKIIESHKSEKFNISQKTYSVNTLDQPLKWFGNDLNDTKQLLSELLPNYRYDPEKITKYHIHQFRYAKRMNDLAKILGSENIQLPNEISDSMESYEMFNTSYVEILDNFLKYYFSTYLKEEKFLFEKVLDIQMDKQSGNKPYIVNQQEVPSEFKDNLETQSFIFKNDQNQLVANFISPFGINFARNYSFTEVGNDSSEDSIFSLKPKLGLILDLMLSKTGTPTDEMNWSDELSWIVTLKEVSSKKFVLMCNDKAKKVGDNLQFSFHPCLSETSVDLENGQWFILNVALNHSHNDVWEINKAKWNELKLSNWKKPIANYPIMLTRE